MNAFVIVYIDDRNRCRKNDEGKRQTTVLKQNWKL
jgi:hypothetical protein